MLLPLPQLPLVLVVGCGDGDGGGDGSGGGGGGGVGHETIVVVVMVMSTMMRMMISLSSFHVITYPHCARCSHRYDDSHVQLRTNTIRFSSACLWPLTTDLRWQRS